MHRLLLINIKLSLFILLKIYFLIDPLLTLNKLKTRYRSLVNREDMKLVYETAQRQFHLFHGKSNANTAAGTPSERQIGRHVDLTLVLG